MKQRPKVASQCKLPGRTVHRNVSVVDLFCGIGGMTHGFIKEGFDVVAGVDIDGTCKYAYERNNPGATFYQWNLERVAAEKIGALFPSGHTRILIGCAPCQPFSKLTQKYAKEGTPNDKWRLVRLFSNKIERILPDIVSMENVPELEDHQVFANYVSSLERLGYQIWHEVVACEDYGVPQARHRLVLLASRFGKIRLIPRTHRKWRTLRDVIGGLDPIGAGEMSRRDPLHYSSGLSPLNIQRIRSTPAGGTWRDWPEYLKLECHKRPTGRSYSTAYGRMRWDEPAPTITTEFINLGSGKFGHPEQDRALSIREGALIQTFPKSYRFIRPTQEIGRKRLARHIGNAVPIRLGRIIARSIRKHLDEYGIT